MKALFFPLLLFSTISLMAQQINSPFFEYYKSFRQEGLEQRRITQQDILPMIQSLRYLQGFTVSKAGESVEGRDIYLVKVGKGKTNVLLWSQMHGDEPTATMALMDIFQFLKQENGPLDSIRQQLLDELTIWFIPMLNPDGAEVYQRRNALWIDLNRDALSLQSPEAQLLKSVRDNIQADWGFNLHDKNILYSAGKSSKPATISFLAPPFDEEKSENASRSRAMKLIVEMNETLQEYIPGQVGKWSDEFEPRAFGDNMQKWGTSTVLIESGGYKGDPEKQYIRKLNFIAIMQGLHSIATGSYSSKDLADYATIPPNERYLFNLLIRNVKLAVKGQEYMADIGINRIEKPGRGPQAFYYKSSIEDLGDLSVFYGYEELDAGGLQAVPGKVFPETFKNLEELKKKDIHQLLSSGYTSVKLKSLPAEEYTRLAINILPEEAEESGSISIEARPDFVLQENGQVRYAIVNGFIYDLRTRENGVKNALVEAK